MHPPFTIINDRLLHKGFGSLREIKYSLNDATGNHKPEKKAELYDTGNAVAILLYHKARRKVLLVRQFRLPAAVSGGEGGYLTEVCAGKIEDLSPGQTACKEVEEETGYRITAPRQVMELYMSPGAFAERIYFFIAAYDDAPKVGEGGGLKEEGESVTLHEPDFDEAQRMVSAGEIIDAKTVILLQYAVMTGLMEKQA